MSLVALIAALAMAASHSTTPAGSLGVYRGAGAPGQVAAFERWNGDRPVTFALDYLASDEGWGPIAHPGWWAARWQGTGHRMVYAVPLLPAGGGTLEAGAEGAYDEHFASMARTLLAHGQGDAILRLGWEFNGDFYPWSAARDPAAFAGAFRHAVDAIRSVPGAAFTIDWNPNAGANAVAPERAYPGDAYVDVIGLDAYDQDDWAALERGPYGLAWQQAFATAHGKPTSIPEWGLLNGDDPEYVRRMHAWIAAHPVLYHGLFDFEGDGAHRLGDGALPASAAVFRRLF